MPVDDTVDHNDPRYPRRGLKAAARWALLHLWPLVIPYIPVSNTGANLSRLIHDRGLGVLTDFNAVLDALTHPFPFNDGNAIVYMLLLLPVLALGVGYLWARHDLDYEKRVIRKIDMIAAVIIAAYGQQEQDTTLRTSVASQPPFDHSQLPRPEALIGRDPDLELILRRVRVGGVTNITALKGMAGIGKTALAAEAAYRLFEENRFPDGIAVVICEEQYTALDVLRRVLGRFDPRRRLPSSDSIESLSQTARQILDNRKVLIIIDAIPPEMDISSVVEPLRAAHATLLLVSRQSLPLASFDAETHTVNLLTPEHALDLFIQSYAPSVELSADECAAAQRIVAALGQHTLAVKLIGKYASDQKRDLAVLAEELQDISFSLELPLGYKEPPLEQAIRQSTRNLQAEHNKLFVALSAFTTPEFGRLAVTAVGKSLGLGSPRVSLDALVARALIEPYKGVRMPDGTDKERLRIHLLLRGYAMNEWSRWSERERAAAYLAVAQYYAQYAANPTVANTGRAADEVNIEGALKWAHKNGRDDLVAEFCTGMMYFWRDRGHTQKSLDYLPWGIEATEAVASVTGESDARLRAADMALEYGEALRRTGQIDDAEKEFNRNLKIRKEEGDRSGEAVVRNALGWLCELRGQFDLAVQYCHEAEQLYRQVEDPTGIGVALSSLGHIALSRGRLTEAESYFEQSLPIRQQIPHRRGEGIDLLALGRIALARKELDKAEDYFNQSIRILRIESARRNEGEALSEQGYLAQIRNGQFEEIARKYQGALLIAREVQDRRSEAANLRRYATLLTERGGETSYELIEKLYRDSLNIATTIQNRPNIAATEAALGAFLVERKGSRQEGSHMLRSAANSFHEMGLQREEEEVSKLLTRYEL